MPELHVIERRIFPTEFREVPGSNGRQRWATAVTYNRTDSYGTIWLPGCFNAGLDERMPTILYGHDWYSLEHVLGQGIDYKDEPGGCAVLIEFADPTEVPSARLAMTLTAPPKPVLKDVSVGFDRQEWLKKDDLTPEQLAQGGEEAMVAALMDELSIVVRGAVPDAALRTKRSWVIDGTVVTDPEATAPAETERSTGVALDDLLAVAKRQVAGELSRDEASAALDLLDGRAAENRSAETRAAVLAPLDVLVVALDDDDLGTLRCAVRHLEARMADLFANDQRAMLREALNDRFQPGPDRYVWVVDFNDTEVIFELSGFDDSGLFMLAYTYANDTITLDPGDPVEVLAITTYVPDPDDDGSGTASTLEPEQREPEPDDPDDSELAALVARATARSR